MDYLSLNDEPLVQDATSSPPGLPPEMLTAFTAHFPVLTTLGVYMRIEEGFEEMLLTPKEKFKKLENFRVGTSSIVGADPEEVAAFLASMMPNPKVCIVNTYSSWYPRPLEGVVNNLGWDGVVKAVSACFKAQKRLLRDLKDKEALLEEQRAINASLQEIEISLQTQITALKAEHEACLTQTETTVKQSATTQTPEVPSVESEASTAVKEYQTADVPLSCTIRSEVVSGWPIPDLSPQY
ncbi:hypothetical protein FRC02_009046 [Tulasnella sp. 418]|nr:hypothetical protein FRC02_009046 [Tulasnella sp. 418]